MSALLQLLKTASGTGEVVTIAYAGGSRPGQSRDVVIHGCTDSEMRAAGVDGGPVKQFKVAKILWAEPRDGARVANDQTPRIETQFPERETLGDYIALFRAEFVAAGWHFHKGNNEDSYFGVGGFFKNGKPRKTPTVSICYNDPTNEKTFDPDVGDFATVQRILTGRERPWRVDSKLFSEGKTFGLLKSAFACFMEEVRAQKPK